MKTTQINTTKEFKDLMDELIQGSGPVALDVETEKIKKNILPWELQVYGIGFYTREVQAFAWAEALDPESLQRLIDNKTVLVHNYGFDMHVLRGLGVSPERSDVHDTLVMSHLCDENCSHKLKDLAKSVLGYKSVVKLDDVGELEEDAGATEVQGWKKKMAEYCTDDVLYTFELYEALKPQLEEEGLWSLYEMVERPMLRVVNQMEWDGIVIDAEYLKTLGEKLELDIEKKLAEIREKTGVENLNPGSPMQLSAYFFSEMGYTLPDDFKTPKGAPSTNKEALSWLAENKKDEVAQLVLDWRELSKINSTYVVGILEKLRDRVLHARFNQLGAKTGRFSSSTPNLQNIPARGDELDIRKSFVPRDGHVFVSADYSQIELRLAAYFSECEALVTAYTTGEDVHQATADKMGCERKIGKMINFSVLYGISAKGLSRRIGASEAEAEEFLRAYHRGLPEINKYIKCCVELVRRNGYIQTICGRKRRFPEYAKAVKEDNWVEMKAVERKAANAQIQGSSADIIKLAMKKIAEKVSQYGGRLLLTVHDEVLVEVSKEHADRCVTDVKDLMENVIKLDNIPLIAEPAILTKWGK